MANINGFVSRPRSSKHLVKVPATGFARCSVGGHRAALLFLTSIWSRCHRVEMAGPHSADAECYACGAQLHGLSITWAFIVAFGQWVKSKAAYAYLTTSKAAANPSPSSGRLTYYHLAVVRQSTLPSRSFVAMSARRLGPERWPAGVARW